MTIFAKNDLRWEVIYRNYANGRLRFSTSDIASVRAIRGWCYCRCVAYLTALQSVAICWVACTCNIHPTVGSLAAPSARHYGVDPVMETHPTSSPFHLPLTHCASHVKRTYDVPLHAGNSTASATIICHLNRLNSRRRVHLCHVRGKDAAKLGSRDTRASGIFIPRISSLFETLWIFPRVQILARNAFRNIFDWKALILLPFKCIIKILDPRGKRDYFDNLFFLHI